MLKIFENETKLAETIADEMLAQLENEAQPTFCLAAGMTTSVTCQLFAERVLNRPELLKLKLVSLDEWVGVDKFTVGSCYQMLSDDLFQRLPLKDDQINFFETKGTDLAAQSARLDQVIAENPLTFALMGVGMNGHIGLNEPGMPVLDHASVVELSAITKQVMQKYFKAEVELEQGITLGLAQVLSSKRVVVALIGAHKAEIAREIFENPAAGLPAQYFLGRENVDFYLDQAAANQLKLNEEN